MLILKSIGTFLGVALLLNFLYVLIIGDGLTNPTREKIGFQLSSLLAAPAALSFYLLSKREMAKK